METYSAGAGRDVASMVDNEQLKSTAPLPLYITSESAISWKHFFALLLPSFYEKKFKLLGVHVVPEDLSIDLSITNGFTCT